MKIALAGDHGGFHLKGVIATHLESKGHKITDFGSYTPDPVDYPDYAFAAAESVAREENDRAILLCRTGIGESIAANKVNESLARTSRTHNNANVLCLAGDYLDDATVLRIVDVWLTERFQGGRHKRRLDKIACYEALDRKPDKACPEKRRRRSARTSARRRSGAAG
jgi:ribose 5-phosphate isomerase B